MNKRYSIILIIFCILVFLSSLWLFFRWVKEDSNDTSSLNTELDKKSTSSPVGNNLVAAANKQVKGAVSPQTTVQSPPSPSSQTEMVNKGTTNPEEKKEEASNKKTFQSDTLKASFEYTDDLKINEGGNLITITSGDKSWKIRFYENKKNEDLETWYKGRFETEDNPNCTFNEGTVKAGSHTSKLVKVEEGEGKKCDNGGNYAINTEKTRVIKIDLGKETEENVNKIMTTFKFL